MRAGKKGFLLNKKEVFKRYGLFVISLWFSALGVAFAKCGSLGVSPVSSVANVLSLRFTALTMGDWLILWSVLLIVGQIAVLRKRYQLIQLLQLPMAFLFGWFTDGGMVIARLVPVHSYPMQLLMVVIGFVLLGFGVALAVDVGSLVAVTMSVADLQPVRDIVSDSAVRVRSIFFMWFHLLAAIVSLSAVVNHEKFTVCSLVFTEKCAIIKG